MTVDDFGEDQKNNELLIYIATLFRSERLRCPYEADHQAQSDYQMDTPRRLAHDQKGTDHHPRRSRFDASHESLRWILLCHSRRTFRSW